MDYAKKSLEKHAEWKGKIETVARVPVESQEDLSVAYTPGVAAPCMAIHEDVEKSFDLTRRWNTVPVITDGTAVLGLGDIGPEAGMPVMEGKCALFKAFGNVDAYPICLRSKDTEEIIKAIELMAGSFGGINLEDISAPRCFEIEQRLKQDLDIPVFHDDQHGTAIVTAAALLNALKLVKKDIEKIHVVVNGAGAAGDAIARFLMAFGVKDVISLDSKGILLAGDPRLKGEKAKLAEITNPRHIQGGLMEACQGADVFVGVSVAGVLKPGMVKAMAEKPIIFACANPIPEILPEEAKAAGAYIVGTGSSIYANQINNVLVFPGLFRGALDARASTINDEMMMAASRGIAACIKEEDLSPDFILPKAYDKKAHEIVAKAVFEEAIKTGVSKLYHQ